jgi:hypothetical protein
MIERVVADRVALGDNLLKNCRMFAHIIANTKKGGFGIRLFQLVKNEFGRPGNGTIVKRQVNLLFISRYPPVQSGI